MDNPEEAIGIDIGKVISDAPNDGRDDEAYMQTPPIEGAFEVIREIVAQRFGPFRTHLVSKCGDAMQAKTLQWLDAQNFYERTGVLRGNVWFCYKRSEKAEIAQKLGLTHFIDDRLEILNYLERIVPLRILFRPNPKEVARHAHGLPSVRRVESWAEVRSLLVL